MPFYLKLRVRKDGDKAHLWLLARHQGKPSTEENIAYGKLSQTFADQVMKLAKDGYLMEVEIGPDMLPEEKEAAPCTA